MIPTPLPHPECLDALRNEIQRDPLECGYADMSRSRIAATLNAATRPVPSEPAVFSPSDILNAITANDLMGLSPDCTPKLMMFLSGNAVDISKGTSLRAAIRRLFPNRTDTLARLDKLVAPFDDPPPISRAAEIGWPGGYVSVHDVEGALS